MNIKKMNIRKRVFKKHSVSFEDWEEMEDNASAVKYFLKNKRFALIRNYLKEAMEEAEKQILENRIKDVHEEVKISDRIKKIFITPKKTQVDELVGAYKFIKKFFEDMEYMVRLPNELLEKEAKGEITIERPNET